MINELILETDMLKLMKKGKAQEIKIPRHKRQYVVYQGNYYSRRKEGYYEITIAESILSEIIQMRADKQC